MGKRKQSGETQCGKLAITSTTGANGVDAVLDCEVVRLGCAGDEKVLPQVREMMGRPAFAELADRWGNLANRTIASFTNKAAGKNLFTREAVRHKLDAMRSDVSGENPHPIELLLVERILVCWLHLYTLESSFAALDGYTLDLGRYYQHAIDKAHRRYLSSIKALSDVRRLAVPLLMQQINVNTSPQVTVVAMAE